MHCVQAGCYFLARSHPVLPDSVCFCDSPFLSLDLISRIEKARLHNAVASVEEPSPSHKNRFKHHTADCLRIFSLWQNENYLNGMDSPSVAGDPYRARKSLQQTFIGFKQFPRAVDFWHVPLVYTVFLCSQDGSTLIYDPMEWERTLAIRWFNILRISIKLYRNKLTGKIVLVEHHRTSGLWSRLGQFRIVELQIRLVVVPIGQTGMGIFAMVHQRWGTCNR